jgi:hypothetical protein
MLCGRGEGGREKMTFRQFAGTLEGDLIGLNQTMVVFTLSARTRASGTNMVTSLFRLVRFVLPTFWFLTLASNVHGEDRFNLLDASPPPGLGCLIHLQAIRPIWFKEGSTAFLFEDEFWRASRALLIIWETDRGYLIVEGHVDHHEADTGDGQDLSRKRADRVAEELEKIGIPREFIVPVGRADTRYDTSYDPGSRVAPINRRVQIIPTHWGRTCNEHFLIRYTMFFSQNCRGNSVNDPTILQRCEQAINAIPTIHRDLVRTGKIGEIK